MDETGLMIKRNRAKERRICYNRNIQSEELEMTSLNDPVHQREIEEKKRGSGKRTVQIFKKKKKGMNMDQNTLLGVLIPFVGTTAGAACVFFLKNELKPIIQKTLLGFASGGDGGGVGLVTFNSVDEYVRSDGASGISAGIHWFYGGYSDAAFAGSCDPASASGK